MGEQPDVVIPSLRASPAALASHVAVAGSFLPALVASCVLVRDDEGVGVVNLSPRVSWGHLHNSIGTWWEFFEPLWLQVNLDKFVLQHFLVGFGCAVGFPGH